MLSAAQRMVGQKFVVPHAGQRGQKVGDPLDLLRLLIDADNHRRTDHESLVQGVESPQVVQRLAIRHAGPDSVRRFVHNFNVDQKQVDQRD